MPQNGASLLNIPAYLQEKLYIFSPLSLELLRIYHKIMGQSSKIFIQFSFSPVILSPGRVLINVITNGTVTAAAITYAIGWAASMP